MAIPKIEANNIAIATFLPSSFPPFLSIPQRIEALNIPYTVKCPNLSIAIKSKMDSGRFIPAVADKPVITKDHKSVGR